ncbi:MAG: hypothetical protein MK132_24845 [Lentisphaerales bacterium]|nr:hypothetical protein [Lentisphaerales bacterium]
MGFQFRWLAENSHVRICIYKNPEFKRYVDILFVENENAPQISVKYVENPKTGI